MAVRIEMPELSSEGESAALVSWLVKPGDSVAAGEIIAELETDKSTVELEAPAAGIMGEIVVAAGTEDVAPGTLLATLDSDSTDTSKASSPPSPPSPPSAAAPSTTAPQRESAESRASEDDAQDSDAAVSADEPASRAGDVAATPVGPDVDDPRASTPLARRAAADRGLDLASIEGSGPGGRILEADVLAGADRGESKSATGESRAPRAPTDAKEGSGATAAAGQADHESIRMSAMRKTIARRMTESKQQVPHFYLSIRCSMDVVMEFRARLNAELAAAGHEVKISVNDFIVKATAMALREVPDANVRFAGESIQRFERIDVAIAVATDGGLVTPVVRRADRKGLTVLAEETRTLAERARSGSLRPEEYQDGTITISNLGMYGIESVYPILNPPQACILGVGAAEEQAVVRDGALGIGRVASITLAADHRVVDGAVGAELLAAVRARLEDPLSMML